MNIGVLTSSRADYGIYLPLLRSLKSEKNISLELIAFGTHLSRFHGYTIDDIKKDDYNIIHEISSILTNDNEISIASSYGLTLIRFAEFWSKYSFDLVFCLGDRYEMSAAVQAGIPFQINFAHLHGGETTLGAIDNIYRHQITLASTSHFVATKVSEERVKQLTDNSHFVFNVGSLSLNDFENFRPKEKTQFLRGYQITFDNYVLATFHPETVSSKNNLLFAEEMKEALKKISNFISVIVTMPNADTLGSIFREKLLELKKERENNIVLIENFGKENYFNAMYYSELLIGNTSSGIIEAASFGKYVLNVGDRQKGRVQSDNIVNVNFNAVEIIKETMSIIKLGPYKGKNVYFKENSVGKIKDAILNKLK